MSTLTFISKRKMMSKNSQKFWCAQITVKTHPKNPNIYYKVSEDVKNSKILKHMCTMIKVNGGCLIRKHTTEKETYISEDLTIKNNAGEFLIKNSNPFFYVSNEVLEKYADFSYEVKNFPYNFKNDINGIRDELVRNLKNGYIDLMKSNDVIDSNNKLLILEKQKIYLNEVNPNKLKLFLKENANYTEKENLIIIADENSRALNKKMSIIFYETKDMDLNKFVVVHSRILENDPEIGNELIKQ